MNFLEKKRQSAHGSRGKKCKEAAVGNLPGALQACEADDAI